MANASVGVGVAETAPVATSRTPEDDDEFKDYRNLMKASATLSRIDTHAKWILGSTTIVTALFALYATAKIDAFDSVGKIVAGVAVACVGVALALASLALLPVHGKRSIQWDQLSDLRSNAALVFARRYRWLKGAGSALAIGLALAALVPIVGQPRPHVPTPRVVATIDFPTDKGARFGARVFDHEIGDWVDVSVYLDGNPRKLLAHSRSVVADGSGTASLDKELSTEGIQGRTVIIQASSGKASAAPVSIEIPAK